MEPLPDPAVLVLIGAAGSGKSTWAAQHYSGPEIVSSDALRGIVGSGPADLDATTEAFSLLDQIIAGRTRRRLTTVIDTLGLDRDRRLGYLAAARAAQLPAVAVLISVDEGLCRERNARRDRPVPAPALARQLRSMREIGEVLAAEGWDRIVVEQAPDRLSSTGVQPTPVQPNPAIRPDGGPELILQLSRFPWGEDPLAWLTAITRRADEIGLAGIALMDHLIQIPQVGRSWEPIPEPWVTLGALAGLATGLRLGTLVSPVTFRAAGITAKAAATLDALSGGRAFLGLGGGWWEREHAGFGLPFPPAHERLDRLETAIETCRALWATGTKAYVGRRVELPETTCYPRPTGRIPIIVGGSGEARTLRIAARHADGCNLPSDPETLDRSWPCCAGTVRPSVATRTRWRSPCSTCRSSEPIATMWRAGWKDPWTYVGGHLRRPPSRRHRRHPPASLRRPRRPRGLHRLPGSRRSRRPGGPRPTRPD